MSFLERYFAIFCFVQWKLRKTYCIDPIRGGRSSTRQCLVHIPWAWKRGREVKCTIQPPPNKSSRCEQSFHFSGFPINSTKNPNFQFSSPQVEFRVNSQWKTKSPRFKATEAERHDDANCISKNAGQVWMPVQKSHKHSTYERTISAETTPMWTTRTLAGNPLSFSGTGLPPHEATSAWHQGRRELTISCFWNHCFVLPSVKAPLASLFCWKHV